MGESATDGRDPDSGSARPVVRFRDFTYDRSRGVLCRRGEEIDVPPRALGLLELLLARPAELATREELEDALWDTPPSTPRSLNEAVMQLRRALDDDSRDPRYVQTVHRRGYRFIAPVRTVKPGRGAELPEGTGAWRSAPRRLGMATAMLAMGLAGMVLGAILAPPIGSAGEVERDPSLRVRLALDAPLVPGAGAEASVAVSADGTRLVYVARSPTGTRQLRLVELGGGPSRLLDGTEGRPRSPFFSPDGRWIAYFADGLLWRVATGGGEPLALAEVLEGQRVAGTWTATNDIVFSRGRARGLWMVPAHGGEVRRLTFPGGGGRSHLSPHALPDTSVVAYVVEPRGSAPPADSRIDWVDVGTGTGGTLLPRGGGRPRATRSGLLVFSGTGGLQGLRIDLRTPRPLGRPRTLVTDVLIEGRGSAQYDLSADGTLVYAPRRRARLEWSDRRGGRDPLELLTEPPRRFALALHRPLLALERRGDLAILDLSRGTLEPWVTDAAADRRPVWAPDGETLFFASNRRGPYDIYRLGSEGPAVPVATGRHDQMPESVSADGSVLIFSQLEPGLGADLWSVPADGSGAPEPVLRTPFDERDADLSPDGHWLAYVSDEGGAEWVTVRPWGRPGPILRIPRAGARTPRWSPKGDELFFIWIETLWSVRWPADPGAGLPSPVPASLPGAPVSQYAVAADGQRFLVGFGPDADVARLEYLENWAAGVLTQFPDPR